MKNKNLDAPKEGDVVVVTGKIDGNMKDRLGDERIGTCVLATSGSVGVLFESSDMWWGKPYEIFIHEMVAPQGLEPRLTR